MGTAQAHPSLHLRNITLLETTCRGSNRNPLHIKIYVNKLRWLWVLSTYRNSTLKACNMSSILTISSSLNGNLSLNAYFKSFIVSIPDLRLLLTFSAFFYVKPA